jgi:hypothetical protein
VATSNTTVRPTKARNPANTDATHIFSNIAIPVLPMRYFRSAGVAVRSPTQDANIFDRTTEAGPGEGARAHLFEGLCGQPKKMAVCTENLIRVDDAMESPKLAE